MICRDVAVASQEQPKYPRLAASAIRSMRSMSWCRSLPRPLPLPGETRPWSPRRFCRHPTSNEVYFNSELSLRVRAVDFLFLEDPEPTGATALLGAMSDPADGVFDEIQAARDESKADLVALISGNDYAFCGVAFPWPWPGFGLVANALRLPGRLHLCPRTWPQHGMLPCSGRRGGL